MLLQNLGTLFGSRPVSEDGLTAIVGPTGRRLAAWVTEIDAVHHPLVSGGRIERNDSGVSRVHFSLRTPFRIHWAQVTAAFGPGEEGMATLDAWHSPIPYDFEVRPDERGAAAQLTLWLTSWSRDRSGWTDRHTPREPLVTQLSVRQRRLAPKARELMVTEAT